jgi:hypothetical protein
MKIALLALFALAPPLAAQRSARDTAGSLTWPVTRQDSTARWSCVRNCDAATIARVDLLNARIGPNYVTFDRQGNTVCRGPNVATIEVCPQYDARRARRRGARR